MKNVDYAFFLTAFVATIGALIITAVNEASFNIALVLLTFALVLITFVYARRTAEIAKASVKMAEETRKHRYAESLPLLAPTISPILPTDELPYKALQSGVGVKVVWHNVGKGAAINWRFCFYPVPISSGKVESFPAHKLGTLEAGSKKKVDFDKIFERYNRETRLLDDGRWHQISNTYRPRLEAKYQDIYERNIITVQEFRIEEENGSKKAFVGELYFTVNGKRLGEEITSHD